MAGANTASARGLESVFLNVAGLTGIEGTEIAFSHSSWFADISIQSFCGDITLRKSIALISLADYALAADSGLGHISSIIGVSTVSFFGAKRSVTTRPIGNNIILDKSERCEPCKKNICCLNVITKSDIDSSLKSL